MRNLKPLVLYCGVLAGAEYDDTIKSARRLAVSLKVVVDFKFNGRAIQVDRRGNVFDDEPPYPQKETRP